MADSTSLINEFTKSSLVYEGYLTIRTGTVGDFVYKKYDQLMELSIDVVPEIVTHFNSTKKKHNVVVGDNSTSVISLKDTVDLYRKSTDPVNTTSLTDIKKILRNQMKVVPATFTAIQKTETTSNPDLIILMRLNFQLIRLHQKLQTFQ